MIVFFDTETGGLPVNGVPSNDPRHPDMVSIAAILDDDDGTTIETFEALNKDARDSDPGAFKVHGISKSRCEQEGIPLSDIITRFREMAVRAGTICAFNSHFDLKIIKIACARSSGGEDNRSAIEALNQVCAMEAAAAHLLGKKRISLKNAYFDLFKRETQTDQFHGALKDAHAAREVYYELKKRGFKFEPKPILRVYDTPYEQSPQGAPVGKTLEVEL